MPLSDAGPKYGTVHKYGTVRHDFYEEVRYALVRYAFFCSGTGSTIRWYGTL